MKITDEMIEEVHEEIIRDWLVILSTPEECRHELLESLEEKMRALTVMMYRRMEESITK